VSRQKCGSELKQLVIIVPHATLGDTTIVLDCLRQILLKQNLFKVVLILNKNIASNFSSIIFPDHIIIQTQINFWKYSIGKHISKIWRVFCYLQLLLPILRIKGFSLRSNVLFLGPDWITNSRNSTDLFSSIFTRVFSRKFIPSASERSYLMHTRRQENYSHRDFISEELRLISVLEMPLKKQVICQQINPSEAVVSFLKKRDIFGEEFLLCFLGAGAEARDWTGKKRKELLEIANSANLKALFVGVTEVHQLSDFCDIFAIIGMSKICVSNDTGWAHLVIAMAKPLVAVSPVPNPLHDFYLQSSELVKVVRPAVLAQHDVNSQLDEAQCISQIRKQDVADAVLGFVTRPPI
jgi:hypothetical protein